MGGKVAHWILFVPRCQFIWRWSY